MAERSQFWTTNNTGHGPSSGYASDRWRDMLRKLLQSDRVATGSVLFGVDNQLAVTGAASPLSINTGAALAYGFFYENDAAKALAITTPVVGTTGGRVILRADFAAQTVTAIVNRNTDGVAAIPVLVQTPGTTYDVPIATFTITTGGVVTLIDTREYAKFSARVYGSQLDTSAADASTLEVSGGALRVKDAGITPAKLAAAVAGNGLIGGAGAALEVNPDGVTLEISGDAVRIKDLGVSLAKLAADSVDDTKAGNRIPQFYRRQGGNASDWSITGTTTYTPTSVRMQGGSGVTNASGAATITFPVAFSQKPICFVSADTSNLIFAQIRPLSATQAAVTLYDETGTGVIHAFSWLAIGAE
jgi:hypothetical protein